MFMLGHARFVMEEKAMRSGAVACLRKPFDDQELLDAINRSCGKEI
jgi:FixJ family two-component response regulator